MVVHDLSVEERLRQFVKEYDGDHCSLELLLFLGRHPHARFSQLAIVHALNSWRLDVERALRHLKDKGLITTHAENGTAFYSLTENESLRNPVLDLLKIDWYQWQPVLRQVYPAHD